MQSPPPPQRHVADIAATVVAVAVVAVIEAAAVVAVVAGGDGADVFRLVGCGSAGSLAFSAPEVIGARFGGHEEGPGVMRVLRRTAWNLLNVSGVLNLRG